MIRTWWAAAALLAVLAMHGLASHAGGHEPIPAPTASGTQAAPMASGHDAHAGTDGSHAQGDPSHESSVFGLCVVVLATSALMLVLRHRRPRSGLLDVLPRALGEPSYATGGRSGSPPPDLHALSVLRC